MATTKTKEKKKTNKKSAKEIVEENRKKIVDKLISKYTENMAQGMFCDIDNPNRPLFSEETARKIMGHMNNTNVVGANTNE